MAWAPGYNTHTHTHTSRSLDQASARARVTEATLIFPLWVHLPAEKGSRCCNPTPASAPLGILVFPVPSIFSMKFLCLPPSQRTQAKEEGWRSKSGESTETLLRPLQSVSGCGSREEQTKSLWKKETFQFVNQFTVYISGLMWFNYSGKSTLMAFVSSEGFLTHVPGS